MVKEVSNKYLDLFDYILFMIYGWLTEKTFDDLKRNS